MSITERILKNGTRVYDNQFMYKGIRYKKRGFLSKGQAENWEIDIKYQVNKNGSYYEPCKKTLIDVWYEYYELNRSKYSLNTIVSYDTALNHIKSDRIAKIKISQLDYTTLQKYFYKLAETYSKGVCLNIKSVFNLTFKHAIRCKYIDSNPMLYIEVKGKEIEKKDKKTLSYDEFITLCDCLLDKDFNKHSLYIAMNIGYYTGARLTEILALNKSDIDFNNKTITFNKRLENGVRNPYITKMKTPTSYATVPLAKPLEQILLEWFKINPYDIVCTRENGEYIRAYIITYNVSQLKKKTGIDFHFHMLRHTFITNLYASGIDIKTAQRLARHSNINTTLNIYTHSNTDKEQQAIDMVFNKKIGAITPKLPQNQKYN